jgi:hypothetical protein
MNHGGLTSMTDLRSGVLIAFVGMACAASALDSKSPRTAFVSEAELQSRRSDAAQEQALAQIDASLPASPTMPCYQPPDLDAASDAQGHRVGGRPPLSKFQSIVLAKVISLTPGWNIHEQHVTTLVTARILEILHDASWRLRPERVISFEENSGAIKVSGRTLCIDPIQEPSRLGDLVIVAGSSDEANPDYLAISDGYRYFVKHGLVEVHPPYDRSSWRDLSLNEFRVELHRSEKE